MSLKLISELQEYLLIMFKRILSYTETHMKNV
jgi:hypothetical protein